MALTDFFRINLPYGIRKNANGEWFAFNREYIPLGAKERDFVAEDKWLNSFVGVKYKGLTENFLIKLADGHVEKDGTGKIVCVWLYSDNTNPTLSSKYWAPYFDKLKKLSKIQVKKVD